MRTTLEIDDVVLERVKLRAKHERLSAGRLISELVRRQLDAPPNIVITNGVPVLRGRASDPMITVEQTNEMLAALLREESGL